jgi:class I fructose-bisphosphate aldolase
MDLGTAVRLHRLFAHPSGRFCSVAIDHWFGYQGADGQAGLTDLPRTLAQVMPARPSAVTMTKGAAKGCWAPYAGQVPLIVQAGYFTADDRILMQVATPEEAVRLGADALAVAIAIRGPREGESLRALASQVEAAARFNLPVIAHIYPRDYSGPTPRIVFHPEPIQWAVRCGIECGADVIKVGYTGDVASYRQIIGACPVPVIAAGGPRTKTLSEALTAMHEAVQAGARGATIGRNIWGAPDPAAALRAFQAVILDGRSPDQMP